jgi:exosortase
MTTPAFTLHPRSLAPLVALLALPAACLAWAFWPTFVELAHSWNDPQYSHGWLVPVFAAVLLWMRRGRLDRAALRPSWWGLAPLAAGLALHLVGAAFYYTWFEEVALLPCLAGLALLAGGRAAWRWAWPAILFLAFMVPLPFSAATFLSRPLQWLATVCSTFVMQTVGLPALADGNVIRLNEHELNIVEACSGLRMLVVFVALATAFSMVVRRPWIDKLILLASAVPIALVSNVLRITLTGVLYEYGVSSEAAHVFFHDLAGWLMMPVALLFLWAELKLLSRLLIDPPPAPPRPTRVPAARRGAAPPRPPRGRPAAPRERPRPAAPPPAEASAAPASRSPRA